jgi:hypothetical protein
VSALAELGTRSAERGNDTAPQAAVWASEFDLVAQVDPTLAMAMTAQREAILDHEFAAARKCAELILERLKLIDAAVREQFIRDVAAAFPIAGGAR